MGKLVLGGSMSLVSMIKHFLLVAAPVIATQFSIIVGSFIAVTLTGQYSTIDLAAIGVGYNLWVAAFFGLSGILLGVTPIISHALGAKKTESVAATMWQNIYLGLAFATVLILATLLGLSPLLDLLGLEPAAKSVCIQYMNAMCVAFPAMMIMSGFRYIVDAHGNTRYSLYIIGSSVLFQSIFNVLFIQGYGPIPALGGFGAGISTAIAYWYMMLCFLGLITFNKHFKQYRFWSSFTGPSWILIRDQLALGIPIGLSIFAEISIFSAAGIAMTKFGTEIIAAHQAASSFLGLTFSFPLSLSMASTIVIAYELGAKRYQNAITYTWITRGVAAFIALCIGTYSFTHIDFLASLYTKEDHMIPLIESFISYAVFFTIIDAVGTPLQGVLRAYRDVTSVSIITIGTYWGVTVPVAYLCYLFTDFGPYSVWIGLLSSTSSAALCYMYRLRKVQRNVLNMSF